MDFSRRPTGRHVHYSGFVVAGTGFFLTRFTVTLALYRDPVRFYLAGVLPLTLGLGLAAFGVALAVADVDRALVRTTALWCVVGAGTMLLLVVLTLLGSSPGGVPDLETARSQAYLSNFLIGGSVGGTLTGLYAARSRRQRVALEHQANRLAVLNRLLRDEVLNAVTAIRGYASAGGVGDDEAQRVIEKHSDAIAQTIDEVKYLTRSAGSDASAGVPVDLADCLAESARTVTEQHPTADVAVGDVPSDLSVRANERLSLVFTHLLENAVVHADDDSPSVAVAATDALVRVSVSDSGPGLAESERAVLESGSVDATADPSSGLGLHVVRLFVESCGGWVETDVRAGERDDESDVRSVGADRSVDGSGVSVDDSRVSVDDSKESIDDFGESVDESGGSVGRTRAEAEVADAGDGSGASGSTVTVVLPRARDDRAALRPNQTDLGGVRPAIPHLTVALGAALAAGVVYGAVSMLLGGSIAGIGVFYGASNAVVGWLTHEFHSVVFGFAFVGLVSLAPRRFRDSAVAYAAVGAGWAVVVWVVAASVVAPVWLGLLGFPASLPNVSLRLLASHLAWGVSLGLLTAWGYRHVAPWVARLEAALERSAGRG